MTFPSLRESAPLRLLLILSLVGALDVYALSRPKATIWTLIIPCLVPILSGIFVIPLTIRNAKKQ